MKKLFTAALGLVLTVALSGRAQAAPVFGFPDLSFASHGLGILTDGTQFLLGINTSSGDSLVLDDGSGFSAITGEIFASTSGAAVLSSAGNLLATVLSVTQTDTILGHDLFATYRVTTSTIAGIVVGQTIGLDVLAYDCTFLPNFQAEGCKIKGDLAPLELPPAVPEPASMILVLAGVIALRRVT